MKKFFKYLGISILIIFGLMIVFIEDPAEKDVDNFLKQTQEPSNKIKLQLPIQKPSLVSFCFFLIS